MTTIIFYLFCLLILVDKQLNAAKILVYSPTLSKSHMINNAKVADELAESGHDVTILQVHWFEDPKLKVSKHAKLWSFDFDWSNRPVPNVHMQTLGLFDDKHPLLNFGQLKGFHEFLVDACKDLLKTDIVDQIRAQKFDIYIGEQVNLCGTGLSHAAGISIHVWLSSGPLMPHMTSSMGLAAPSSYIPTTVENNGLSDQMSIWQRADNLLRGYTHQYLHQIGIDGVTQLFREKFGQSFPDVGQIAGESPLVLVTSDEFVELPRPVNHNVVYIGGLGMDKNKEELNEEFETLMQKGQDGVVLISFGSVVDTNYTPEPFVENILKTIEQIPQIQFILKLNKDDEKHRKMAVNITNVFVTDWHPQTAILNHPRLRLFFTHGGYGSVMEAAKFATPLLLMGFFSDQVYNAMGVERNKWGRFMSKYSLLEQDGHKILTQKIQEMLQDKSLKINAQRIQHLILTKPQSAHERLISSINFLISSNGHLPELRSASTRMTFIQFYNLDLLLILILALFTLFVLIKKILNLVLNLMVNSKLKSE